MQSDAKRSRGRISLQFCDLQGDFQKLQGEQHPLPVNFPNNFKIFEGSSPDIRSREHFLVMQGRSREHFLVLQGRAPLELPNGGRVGARRGQAGLNAGPRLAEITPV